ncbi:SCO family protein [Rhodobacteraceae bacterium KMM 6894]|nr:SCO family protein [Rhodobacteraceae bacterium KMM 6894]
MTRTLAIAASVSVIALLGATYYVTQMRGSDDVFAQCRSAAVAGGTGAIGGDFTLVDETGQTVTSAEVLSEPSLIYFGYTFCPDVCPLDNARNAEAVELLEERGVMVQPVFITIDPARDTPEVMAEFTEYMHPRMLGLTGSPEQVKAASKAYRTYYKAQEPEEGAEDYYLVDHSTFTYLTLPDHGFVEFFRRDISAEAMAETVQCFVNAGS